jgi:Tol biopolymer transport system component
VLALAGCGDDGKPAQPSQPPQPSRPAARAVLSAGADRAQLAFFRIGNRSAYDVTITDDRGRKIEVLTGDSIPDTPWPDLYTNISWTSDGERVAFAGGKGQRGQTHEEKTDVYVIGAGHSAAKRVTDVGDVSNPLWAPDGKRIVFTRSIVAGRLPRGELWSVRPDGSGLTRLTKGVEGQTDAAGAFSPDGDKLAVTRTSYNPDTRRAATTIYLMNADGTHEKDLIDQAGEPAISPDGKRVAFSSDRDRNGRMCIAGSCGTVRELYLADSDGRNLVRLTRTRTINESNPAWSPDGARIAYQAGGVTDERPGSGIFEMNADGTCTTRFLVDTSRRDWYANPVWRPSSKGKHLGRLSC